MIAAGASHVYISPEPDPPVGEVIAITCEAPAAIVEILDPISIKRLFSYTEFISVKRWRTSRKHFEKNYLKNEV